MDPEGPLQKTRKLIVEYVDEQLLFLFILYTNLEIHVLRSKFSKNYRCIVCCATGGAEGHRALLSGAAP